MSAIAGLVGLLLLASPTTAYAFCGDGLLEIGEDCDDGILNGSAASCCTGNCTEASNGSPCDDGNQCTQNDSCAKGSCIGGTTTDCSDDNVCTDNYCDPASGCVFTNNTDPCDDGNACTAGDTCSGGACDELSFVLTQGDFTTTLAPVQSGGSIESFYSYNTPDFDSANTGYEMSGHATLILHEDPSGGFGMAVILDKANDNSGGSASIKFEGLPAINFVVADDPTEQYDPQTGLIDWVWSECCTDGAAIFPMPGGACFTITPQSFTGISEIDFIDADGNRVNLPSLYAPITVCSACYDDPGFCESGTAVDCDDNDACTTDICNPSTGCQHFPFPGCNGCETNAQCDDGNPCTLDTCNKSGSCVYASLINGSPCDDGDPCTSGNVCIQAQCSGSNPTNCDDNNACTTDSCDPSTGCVNSDTTSECDDGNECTDDTCDPAAGCIYTNNENACDDGDACTTDDACSAGACEELSFTLTQKDFSMTLSPLKSGESIEDFYQYDSPDTASANTGYEVSNHMVLILHEDPQGELGMALILDKANDTSGGTAKIKFEGLPAVNFVVADDDSEQYDPQTGFIDWTWSECCTDGAAIFPMPGGACFTITPQQLTGITQIDVITGTGEVVPLPQVIQPITICSSCIDDPGFCLGGPPLDCDDNNPCTTDVCDSANGCEHVPIAGCTTCTKDSEC
ncbi:MAG: hypothetical protein VX223_01675, partial [Myxococcota bacterium]|nr:hypothetical protein [Myxococcota bacterium]